MDRWTFNIELGDDFHIMLENDTNDIPEPFLPEDRYYIPINHFNDSNEIP